MSKYGSNFMQSQKSKKSPIRGLLPIMGLSLAILFGVMAFFLAPPIVDWAREQDGKIGEVVTDMEADIPEDWPEQSLSYVVAIVLWLVTFSLSMVMVAAMIGEDPEKLALKELPASPANKKATIKQMKKDLKEAKRRESERKSRRS